MGAFLGLNTGGSVPLGERPAVIFDLDGTLADTGADITAAANMARKALGMEPIAVSVAQSFIGDGVQRLMERVLGYDPVSGRVCHPVVPDVMEAGLEHYRAYYGEHLLDSTRLYPGIADLLAGLSNRPLFLATNKPRRFTLPILAGLGIDAVFQRVVAGDDAPLRKPDPAHLAACLTGTCLEPRHVVVVGDSPNDILAARGLGSRSVAVAWGLVPVERLISCAPDALVHDVPGLVRELDLLL